MRESFMDRALVPCLFLAGCVAVAMNMKQDAMVIMLYAIGVLLARIERQLSRRAGARGESDG